MTSRPANYALLILGMTLSVLLCLTDPASAFQDKSAKGQAKDPAVGDWEGVLEVSGGLRFVLHIQSEAKKLIATCDSPDQSVSGVRVTSVTRKGMIVEFTVARADMAFRGKLGHDAISGVLTQHGREFELVLRRVHLPSSHPSQ